MASNEGIGKVLTVAVALCLVCSVVVSSAAVLLRDAQQANKALADMGKLQEQYLRREWAAYLKEQQTKEL